MDDLIKRQDAIDALFEWYETPMDQDAVDVICNVPPAQQWVSCSERLPEPNSERIILLYDNGLISGGKYLGDKTFVIDFQDIDKKTKVVAWMPLPESWKESEDEE